MATVEHWFEQDLKKPVKVHTISGNMFSNDDNGALVGVRVFSNGEPVTLSGTVVGYAILASGSVISIPGTRSGNTAYILMPKSALGVPGMIKIMIKLTEGSQVTTLMALSTSVYNSDGVVIDPSAQQIAEWTAYITNTLATIAGTAVRYDTTQSLTTEQKTRAKTNIGAHVTVEKIEGDDYRVIFP